MKDLLIENLVDLDGRRRSFAISAGRFVDAGTLGGDIRRLDGKGRLITPGLVDLHTHLREPGREDAETVLSGSQAAVAGGYTAISAMPNTSPVADTAGVVEQVYRLGQSHGLCEVFPIGAVTVGQAGEQLAELVAMNQSEAQVRLFSDDGYCVWDPSIMRRALEYVKQFDGIIAQHAQDPRLTQEAQMNEGVVSARLGLKGWPAAAEESIIARDILLTDHVESRLHICHVTTARGVELIRWAKARGIRVTAEVTPHHLLLTDQLAETYDPIYKVNPPLRTESDVMALREGVVDGTIDIIATDHAPHPTESKECEWQSAAFGMVGLETSLSVSYLALVSSGLIPWSQLVERMSITPAQIAGYGNQGSLKDGAPANFAIFDPNQSWQVEPAALRSKSKNTPFAQMELPGRVVATFFRGEFVYGEEGL